MNTPDPVKKVEAAAEADVAAGKSWLSGNRPWLIAVAVAFILGCLTRCL